MWPRTFSERLNSWILLRDQNQNNNLETALTNINNWWFKTPWSPYYLHWDDRDKWPDPWELLSDNIFCSLARALGIMYTLAIIERNDLENIVLCETKTDNLVLISQRKYILNWDPGKIVNINHDPLISRHQVTLQEIKTRLK
jgi:hypothetical protein